MSGAAKEAMRTMKNVAMGFSDLQIDVRQATSNDPANAPTQILYQLARRTNSDQDFAEILYILRKRLNDHGKNWRHVLKSLVLLDYIIRHGSSRVGEYSKRHIMIVKTLCDFQYIDESGCDCGLNVRALARKLTHMLEHDDELKAAREKAKETRAKSARGLRGNSTAVAGDSGTRSAFPAQYATNAVAEATGSTSNSYPGRYCVENMSEEEQLKLAMEMSKREEDRARNHGITYNSTTSSRTPSTQPPAKTTAPLIDLLGDFDSENTQYVPSPSLLQQQQQQQQQQQPYFQNPAIYTAPFPNSSGEYPQQQQYGYYVPNPAVRPIMAPGGSSVAPPPQELKSGFYYDGPSYAPMTGSLAFQYNAAATGAIGLPPETNPTGTLGFDRYQTVGFNEGAPMPTQSIAAGPSNPFVLRAQNSFDPNHRPQSGNAYPTAVGTAASPLDKYNLPPGLVDLDNLGQPNMGSNNQFFAPNDNKQLKWIPDQPPLDPLGAQSNMTLAQLQAQKQNYPAHGGLPTIAQRPANSSNPFL